MLFRSDLNAREFLAMAPLAIGCIVIGIWPKPILTAIEPAAAKVVAPYVQLIERQAPKPAAKAASAAMTSATGASE